MEWTWCVSPHSTRGPGHAQHRSGLSKFNEIKYIYSAPPEHITSRFLLFSFKTDGTLFCLSWWTCSGSLAWQWAQTPVDLSTPHLCVCCWRLLSLQDKSVRGLLRWPSHSSRFCIFFFSCECSVVGVIYSWYFIPLLLLLSAELLQTVQGDGSCYGDCMIVSTPKCLLQLYQVYVQLTEETLT